MECYNCKSKKLTVNEESDEYVCLDCGFKYPKQYFFISHSHKDIEKVRIIRNVIEETFFYEPILFFLKCLSDEKEINDLLRREIDERIWFVYCKSKNAEASEYVQFERKYINDLQSKGKIKRILEIDLDKYEVWDESCVDYLRSQIEYKVKKTNIFISYSRDTYELGTKLYEGLSNSGFSVFIPDAILAGNEFFNSMQSFIKKASYKNGAILVLLTKNFVNSPFCVKEVYTALMNNAFIIPLLVVKKGEQESELWQTVIENFPQFKNYSYLTIREEEKFSIDKVIKNLMDY